MSDVSEWQAYIGTVFWESLPRLFVEEILLFFTKIYQINGWTFTLSSLHLLFTDYSPSTEKNEAPNHDPGCSSGNNNRTGSWYSLH